jgi:hypothetical protein
MPKRPPSSANRPQTAQGGGRPTTAGAPHGTNVFDRDPQYTYDHDYIEEEQEEESEDEDVFAFLPPSTAEQQQQQQADNAPLAPLEVQGDSGGPVFSHSVPPPVTPPPAAYIPPTPFTPTDTSPGSDPASPFPPTPGPSTQNLPSIAAAPFLPSVETPPSTESYSDFNSTNPNANSYRLRRINSQGTGGNDRRSNASTMSVELRLGLPELPSTALGIEKEASEKVRYGEKEKAQSAPGKIMKTDESKMSRRLKSSSSMMDSVNGSMSFTPSMLDEETPEGSIK